MRQHLCHKNFGPAGAVIIFRSLFDDCANFSWFVSWQVPKKLKSGRAPPRPLRIEIAPNAIKKHAYPHVLPCRIWSF